jgi:hypothetical protein
MSDVEGADKPKNSYASMNTTGKRTLEEEETPAKPSDGATQSFITNLTVINNNDSTTSPGQMGTLMSFVTIIVAIVVSIIVYSYGPEDIDSQAFNEACTDDQYEDSCKSNTGVLRISFALSILFIIQILFTMCFTRFYDVLWLWKFLIFGALVIGFFNVETDIFGLDGYAWFARVTGFFFLILQQVILIDLAYTWNEKWIEYSQEEDIDTEALAKGNFWLIGIILFSLLFYCISFAGIGIMFWQFNNSCPDSMVILSLSIVLPVIASVIQLFFSDQGSVLTSSIMMLYSVYICYSSISLNPDPDCNPSLDTDYQTLASIIGLVLTAISLVWTTYSAGNVLNFLFYSAFSYATVVLFVIFSSKDSSSHRSYHRTIDRSHQYCYWWQRILHHSHFCGREQQYHHHGGQHRRCLRFSTVRNTVRTSFFRFPLCFWLLCDGIDELGYGTDFHFDC